MKIEEEIFKTYILNENKLIKYGFIKEKDTYKYSIKFMDDTFRANIIINKDGKVEGKVFDLDAESEYTNFRVENITGSFALTIKEEYQNILKDIRNNCFDKKYFIFKKTNKLAELIINKYKVTPEFLWEKNPTFGVFRNKKSEKWFAIIMNIDKSKIIPNQNGEIEILNLKLDDINYLKRKGIYPAYHMNKKSWVSIILDGTLTDEEIMKLVDISYELSDIKDEWIIPANPKYFDVITYIESLPVFSWKQPKNIKLGDTVYIYLGAPYSAILYKCKVIELDLYDEPKNPIMNLELIKKYDPKEYQFTKLKEYGLNSVRSARRIPSKLSKELNK